MTWKETLDQFDRDWKRHERWRNTQNGKTNARNSYVQKVGTMARFEIALEDMPDEVRKRVIEKAESTMRVLVDFVYHQARAEVRQNAIDEARRTILELEGAGAAPPKPSPIPPPEDPTADVARLGAALVDIENREDEEPEPDPKDWRVP